MKVLVIYDTFFGNTEQVARAIGEAFDAATSCEVLRITQVKPEQLAEVDLLIAGSPTRAFRATDAMRKFLKDLSAGALKGVKVAAFDTRADVEEVNSRLLTGMVKLFGYAAEPIAGQLKKKGGEVVPPAEGFFIQASEGPLKEGELERAAAWAVEIQQLATGDRHPA
jgi:flavodoxin I